MRFEALREILLKGGVAPRHVRRYLAELTEHLDDLTAQQRAAGYDGEDAAIRARARLGEDSELAAAMLEQKSLRSIAARAPWLVFGLLPPVAGIAASFILIAPLALIARIFHMATPGSIHAPGWFQTLAFTVTAIGNLALEPALAAGFVFLATRQRISYLWPVLTVILIALLDLQFRAQFAPAGQHGGSLSIGATLWLSHWQSWVETWPLSLARLFLTLLPAASLLRTRSVAVR
jgi:hypothetical protein